jgi:hypothetical protein
MGLFDEELETQRVAKAIETHESPEAFEATLKSNDNGLDWLDALMTAGEARGQTQPAAAHAPLSLFRSDYDYLKQGFENLFTIGRYPGSPESDERHQMVQIRPDPDLDHYLRQHLSDEMRPEDGVFALTANAERVKEAIKEARNTEHWPRLHYLWPLHPILQWLDYKLLSAIGRHRAPVIRVRRGLSEGEALVLISALIPNRRGQPVLDQWFAVRMTERGVAATHSIEEVLSITGLGREDIPNARNSVETTALSKLLPAALEHARKHMTELQREFSRSMRTRATEELIRLDQLRTQHRQQLELEFTGPGPLEPRGSAARREQRARDLDQLFNRYQRWVSETLEIEPRAHLTVAAVLTS